MARASLEDNLKVGQLSVANAAELLAMAPTQIRSAIKQGALKATDLSTRPNWSEYRIFITNLLAFAEAASIPVPDRLRHAVAAFQSRMNPKVNPL